MESLKELIEKKEYQRVLELTKESKDAEALFCRVSAYLGLGRYQDARILLVKERDALWAKNPILTMKATFETRFGLEEFDEAYQDEEDFANRPYISQEVEEVLRGLKEYIRKAERASYSKRPKSEEKIREELTSDVDDFTLLQTLGQIQKDPTPYLKEIREIATSGRNSMLRTFALLLLVGANDKSLLCFSKNGKDYEVSPAALTRPYSGPRFQQFIALLEGASRNTSIVQSAHALFDNYVLSLYPEDALDKDLSLLVAALLILAGRYLHSDPEAHDFFHKHEINEEEAGEFANNIEAAIEAMPSFSAEK
jgi:hypothetical protein